MSEDASHNMLIMCYYSIYRLTAWAGEARSAIQILICEEN
jgi:hypothetical protein